MQVTAAIRIRKSVRAYQNAPVPDALLEKIIEAGQWAPNAGPFQITVIRNAAMREAINARTQAAMLNSGIAFLQERAAIPGYAPLYGAPLVLLLSGPATNPYTALNTALAAENMILEATAAGLGSCFIITPALMLADAANSDLARAAGIPEEHSVQCAVLIGQAGGDGAFALGERRKKGQVAYQD